MSLINKLASLLDPVQDTLSPEIWTADLKLQPNIKEYILNHIRTLTSAPLVSVHLLGSITGYKYTSESDVDVDVILPKGYLTTALWELRRKTNGKKIPGTQHPLNIFLQEKLDNKENTWQDAHFGVYNVLEDKWATPPVNRSLIRDPQNQYWSELSVARIQLRLFNYLVSEWRSDLTRYLLLKRSAEKTENILSEMRKKRTEIETDEQRLWEFAQNLENARRFEYQYGFGIPRENYRNIVYKYIEHSPNGEVFKHFAELKKPPNKNVQKF